MFFCQFDWITLLVQIPSCNCSYKRQNCFFLTITFDVLGFRGKKMYFASKMISMSFERNYIHGILKEMISMVYWRLVDRHLTFHANSSSLQITEIKHIRLHTHNTKQFTTFIYYDRLQCEVILNLCIFISIMVIRNNLFYWCKFTKYLLHK